MKSDDEKLAHAELLLLMQNAWNDIERTKQRQWSDFYHVMIAQGALIGLFLALKHTPEPAAPLLHCVFLVAVTLLTVAGVAIVTISEYALDRRRLLVDTYYAMLNHEGIKRLLGSDRADPKGRGVHVKVYVSTLIVSGFFAAMVIWALV